MKKVIIALLVLFSMPFFLVWLTYGLTAFSFSPKEVFQDSTFWVFSVIYWVFFVPFLMIPILDDKSL